MAAKETKEKREEEGFPSFFLFSPLAPRDFLLLLSFPSFSSKPVFLFFSSSSFRPSSFSIPLRRTTVVVVVMVVVVVVLAGGAADCVQTCAAATILRSRELCSRTFTNENGYLDETRVSANFRISSRIMLITKHGVATTSVLPRAPCFDDRRRVASSRYFSSRRECA